MHIISRSFFGVCEHTLLVVYALTGIYFAVGQRLFDCLTWYVDTLCRILGIYILLYPSKEHITMKHTQVCNWIIFLSSELMVISGISKKYEAN